MVNLRVVSIDTIKLFIKQEMYMNQNEIVSTFDLPLASTLCYLGFRLDGLKRISLSRVAFIFKRTPELDETIEKFWQKELLVEPSAFLLSQRELKSRIYSRQ